MSGSHQIVVKKIKKHTGPHHGGSWKVAYADFVTAMMAFFLLLWLLTMVSDEKRIRLSQYFKHFSLYTEGGSSFVGKTSSIFNESGETKGKVFSSKFGEKSANVEGEDRALFRIDSDENGRKLEEALKKDIKEKLGSMQDQVLVDLVEGGVRIQMIDRDGSSMFEIGSNKLTPKAREVFRVIGNNFNKINNKLAIEGHTDALPYSGNEYSNWELSTERASSARKELEANGLDPVRISRVSGFASTDPLIKEDPTDPRNRRISIIVKLSHEETPIVEEAEEDLPKNELIINAGDHPLILVDKKDLADEENERAEQLMNAIINEHYEKPSVSPGPVMKKTDIIKNQRGHVLEDELNPVIRKGEKDGDSKSLMSRPSSGSEKDKKIDAAVYKKDSSLVLNDVSEAAVKKSKQRSLKLKSRKYLLNNDKKQQAADKKIEQPPSKKADENASVIKELSSPVISNQWSPVINK